MSRYTETQVLNPSNTRVLDIVRAIETAVLVAVAGWALVAYPMPGVFATAALLGVAAVLRPREREYVASGREHTRAELASRLSSEAIDLRTRYMEVRRRPLSDERSQAQWRIRREITVWLDTSKRRVDHYPEIAGIYRAHRDTGGLIDELDSALLRLSEIRRLCDLSTKLRLPF